MRILIQRTGALGDVVMATPIVRWFSYHYPTGEIVVRTAFPDVFQDPGREKGKGFHNVVMVSAPASEELFDRVVNLDLAYERRPSMHVIQAYALEANIPDEFVPEMRTEMIFDRRRLFGDRRSRFVAVHAATAGWRNRTLPRATWREVIEQLKRDDLTPILVGTDRDDVPGVECARFFTTNIHTQARMINSCGCFVGSDSGLLHVAGTTDTPIVGVFTCAKPEYRLPFGRTCAAVLPRGVGCLGCLERQPAPATTEACELTGDEALVCVRAVHAYDVIAAVLHVLVR